MNVSNVYNDIRGQRDLQDKDKVESIFYACIIFQKAKVTKNVKNNFPLPLLGYLQLFMPGIQYNLSSFIFNNHFSIRQFLAGRNIQKCLHLNTSFTSRIVRVPLCLLGMMSLSSPRQTGPIRLGKLSHLSILA